MNVLWIDDNLRTAASRNARLREAGFDVVHVCDGAEGLRQATDGCFDAIVLDAAVPATGGYEVMRLLRKRRIRTPVLMLSASASQYSEVEAFTLGADDYVLTPVPFVVLLARLRALIRRCGPKRSPPMHNGDLVLDPARHQVSRAGIPIDLSPREFALLEHLMCNRHAVCTKADILHSVWGSAFAGQDNIVEVYVSYVRRKIDAPFATNTIETVRGIGYRVAAEATDGDRIPCDAFTAPTDPNLRS